MKKMIAPSLMCVDFMNIGATLRELELCGTDYLHVDIMDGSFVPNYTLGTDFVRALKANTKIPLDIHLMIDEPERKLDWFEFGEGDLVSVHAESTKHLHRTVAAIKARGAKALVAINPATPLCAVEPILEDIDGVLIMTVNPGYAGQKLIPSTLRKIRALHALRAERGLDDLLIEVDGNVSFLSAGDMSAAGADLFVAGSSSVFAKGAPLTENTARLRAVIEI